MGQRIIYICDRCDCKLDGAGIAIDYYCESPINLFCSHTCAITWLQEKAREEAENKS